MKGWIRRSRPSGVGAGGGGAASTPSKILICEKFGQNIKKFNYLMKL